MDNLTIVAPMTPAGVSAVAAIRVSGSHVKDVVAGLFGAKALECLQPRVARLGSARWPLESATIDSLLYLFFEGPNSYTGEDVLELYPHGNPLIVRDLLLAIRQIPGVRLALPGEFTRRAFLNGKMDLIQAESVADVIHSANRAELKNAHRLLSGALSKKVSALTAQVKDISARLELDVDFAEEEADPDYGTWEKKFVEIRKSIDDILKGFRGKASVGRIPLVVLYGAPNAGKSSLVNALLGEDRILVSNVPGTTRDFVEVRLFLDGGEIRLVDTAGIAEKATDALDALSMEKSREILAEADVKVLLVDSCNEQLTMNNEQLTRDGSALQGDSAPLCNSAPDIVLFTKCDLTPGISRDELLVVRNANFSSLASRLSTIQVSSRTGEGLEQLKSVLNERVFRNRENSEDLWITSEREKACLEEARAGIDRALALIRSNPAVELLAFEMQLVRRALQSIVGEITSEDVLQSIFAGFCIGK